MDRARAWHLLTFVVTAFAVVLQLVLVIQGSAHVPTETEPGLAAEGAPNLATRVLRFCSYLTIWSNVLVAAIAATLAAGADRDSKVWRALRLDAVIICFGGGIVHFFFLRPLLTHLEGWDLAADKLLHVVVPVLALIGWLAFGPRGRAAKRDLVPFLVLPLFWLAYTLVRGAFVDWYPYPFLDVNELNYGLVLVNCVGVSAIMLLLFAAFVWVDEHLPGDRS